MAESECEVEASALDGVEDQYPRGARRRRRLRQGYADDSSAYPLVPAGSTRRTLPSRYRGWNASVPPPPQPDPHRLSYANRDDAENEQERKGGGRPQEGAIE